MARTFVPVEGSVAKHPKVRVFAKMYGVHPQLVVGFLVEWWFYGTEFGSAGQPARCHADVTRELFEPVLRIATVLTVPPVEEALRASGLMDEDGHPHDWQDYGGKLLAKRAQDAARQRLSRAMRKSGDMSRHADVTVQRREENKKPLESGGKRKAEPEHIRAAFRKAFQGEVGSRDPSV